MRGKGYIVRVFAILTVLMVCMALVGPAMARNSKRVLIGFSDGAGQENANWRAKFVRDRGGAVHHSFSLIPAVSANLPEQAVAKMKGRGEIAYVEDDIMMYAIGQSTPWGVDRVNAPTAWGTTRGAGVDVAILDTGIDYDHPDLKLAGGVNFAGLSADGQTNVSYWDDGHGHGTHCAGIAAAEDNDIGVVGVAPDANLWAVKVLNDSGSGYVSDIIQGLEWCVSNGIEVASMSFAGGYSASMEAACDEAYAAGVLLVAAAGNYYGGLVASPADAGSVIAVSAVDSNDKIAIFSSVGSQIELAAPGVSIYSTYKGGGYTSMSGTSMACPHVSGVAALVFASSGSGASGVRQRMNDTARDIGLLWYQQGNGLVDAANAVGSAAPPSSPEADFSGNPTSGEASLTVDFTDMSTGSISTWEWDFGDGEMSTSDEQNPSYTYQNAGTYTVYLTVTGSDSSDVCTHTDYISVTEPQAPVADFSGAPVSGEAPLTVYFTDKSTDNAVSWSWDFGDDNGTSSKQNPSYTYLYEGTYTVSLTVGNSVGGSDTYTRIDYIIVDTAAPPVADFSADQTTGGTPLTVSFADMSTGSVTEWFWDFGDGVTSTQTSALQSLSHTYQSAGTYTVSLTVTGSGGSDVLTRVDYITVEHLQWSLSVGNVELKAKYAAKKWQVAATVLIEDSNLNPVVGASVDVIWSSDNKLVSGQTDEGGKVSFSTGWIKNSIYLVEFTIKNVSKYGYSSSGEVGPFIFEYSR